MIGAYRILTGGILAACLLIPARLLAGTDDIASPPDQKSAESTAPAAETAPPAKPEKVLSPAMTALRDRVRETLAAQQKQQFNTHENSATEIMSFCLAFGCGTEVWQEGQNGKRVNGITTLCWNYPCATSRCSGSAKAISPRGSATDTKSIRASSWPCWPCRACSRTIRCDWARMSAPWPIWSRPKSSAAARAAMRR